MGILKLFAWLRIAIPFVVPFALLAEASGNPGPEKRTQVVKSLRQELEKLDFRVPQWFARFVEPLLGLIVDVVVELLNRTGFFEHSDVSDAK